MKTKQILINIILFASLFYLTLIIPIFITTYSQKWYNSNYEQLLSKDSITKEQYTNSTTNLINYLSYQEPLTQIWTQKEKTHYKDVRHLLTIAFILAIIAITIITIFTKNNYQKIKNFTLANIIIILTIASLISINFEYFWNVIFHPLLFSNNYWIMMPDQISYYIFYPPFFTNTIQFIIIIAIIENLLLYTLIKIENLIRTSKPLLFNK